MSIKLFEAIEGSLKEQVSLIQAGVDSEQATKIVFNHWPVEDDMEDFQAEV